MVIDLSMRNMKTLICAIALSLALSAAAFQPSTLATERTSSVVRYEYIPDGFTKQSYAKFKAAEAKKKQQKNLGRMGPKGFQSRSFQSFQEALERGEATHLMPVTNAKERVAKGELRKEDIPYMQRGGNWDNSDVKGAKKVGWLKTDKTYADGGFKKEQSVSIFGNGQGLDWTGKRSRSGPEGVMAGKPKFDKNYKPPNINNLKKQGGAAEEKPKKFFGLF